MKKLYHFFLFKMEPKPTKIKKQKPTNNQNDDKKRKTRGEGNDAKRVMQRIGDWDIRNSMVFGEINRHFHSGLTQPELLKIGEILAEVTGLTIDRDAKRDSRVLVKWFDENWEVIRGEMANIMLYDKNENLISEPSERKPNDSLTDKFRQFE